MSDMNATQKARTSFLVTIAALACFTALFWLTNLDLRVSALFHVPGAGFFLRRRQPWMFLYSFGAILAVGAMMLAAAAHLRALARERQPYWPWHLLYVVMALTIGPSFICNSVLKEHWGRPRPSEIVEFGGEKTHLKPLRKGLDQTGKSFPSGHAAAGFSFLILVPLLKRRRPAWAARALGAGILAGSALGLARIVQGRHFLSDIGWSAGVTYLTALLCYYGILRIPAREDAACSKHTAGTRVRARWTMAGFYAATLLIAVGGLLASPFRQKETRELATDALPQPFTLTVRVDTGPIILEPPAARSGGIRITTAAHGHAWPHVTREIRLQADTARAEVTCDVYRHGLFLPLAVTTRVELAASAQAHIVLDTPTHTVTVPSNWTHTAWLSIELREASESQQLTRTNRTAR